MSVRTHIAAAMALLPLQCIQEIAAEAVERHAEQYYHKRVLPDVTELSASAIREDIRRRIVVSMQPTEIAVYYAVLDHLERHNVLFEDEARVGKAWANNQYREDYARRIVEGYSHF